MHLISLFPQGSIHKDSSLKIRQNGKVHKTHNAGVPVWLVQMCRKLGSESGVRHWWPHPSQDIPKAGSSPGPATSHLLWTLIFPSGTGGAGVSLPQVCVSDMTMLKAVERRQTNGEKRPPTAHRGRGSEEQQLSLGEDGHVNQRYFCSPTSHLFYLSIISNSIISKCRV